MKFRLEDAMRSGRLLLRGAYPALVTGLAAALLVLLLWPQRERTFVAETIASAEDTVEHLAAADVQSWLTSDEVLRTAVANLRSHHPREWAELCSHASAGDPLAQIRDQVELVPLASPEEAMRLAIGCSSGSRRASSAMVVELASQLAAHHPAHVRRQRLAALAEREQQTKAELESAKAAEQRLEIELAGLRHAHLASAVAIAPVNVSSASAEPTRERPTSETARMLESLKLERDRLLEIYLPAHPQIQSLSAQISRLEQTLRRSTPPLNSQGATSLQPRPSQNNVLLEWQRRDESATMLATGQLPVANGADRGTDLAAALRQTQTELLSAAHRRQSAEQAWQSLAAERRSLESESEIAWRIEPPRVMTAGQASARHPLAAALIAAVAGGLGIGWFASRYQPLRQASELRQVLGLPVVATLASGDSADVASQTQSRAPAAVQWIVRGAEVVLATFVLTLLAALALDGGLAGELVKDPVGTLGELVTRLI